MSNLDDNWDSIRRIQSEVKEWADSVFPNRTAHDALCKLMLEEIPEFALAQKDESEYADMVILILDIASLNGIDVSAAVARKMAVNRERQWAVDPVTKLMRHK